ncbi:MAG: lysozyme inhibitor LprI family protein [Hyphomonadaceae bacterium]
MRAILLLFAIAAIAACATTSQAQPRSGVDACLAAATPETRRDCIGAESGPCIEEPFGSTTGGMVQCVMREKESWEAQVRLLTLRLRARETPTQLAQLDAMLAAYGPWLQARCGYAGSIYEGGSLSRVVAALCIRDTTAQLAIDLLERFDDL